MRLFLLHAIIFFLFSSCANSQHKIYFNPDSTKYVEVSCTHNRNDTDGNPSRLKWLIFQQHSPSSYVVTIDTCITQTIQGHIFSVITNTTNTFNHTYFSVFTVDSSNTRSDSHFSTSASAAFGGWILVPDNSIPAPPDTLNISF